MSVDPGQPATYKHPKSLGAEHFRLNISKPCTLASLEPALFRPKGRNILMAAQQDPQTHRGRPFRLLFLPTAECTTPPFRLLKRSPAQPVGSPVPSGSLTRRSPRCPRASGPAGARPSSRGAARRSGGGWTSMSSAGSFAQRERTRAAMEAGGRRVLGVHLGGGPPGHWLTSGVWLGQKEVPERFHKEGGGDQFG